ncbi:MAG: hypothetical protein EPN99_00490 [Frankiales bacterium]|nr:MAG: hypothetical protein EPN99_00490 [Frankiales bacterium]
MPSPIRNDQERPTRARPPRCAPSPAHRPARRARRSGAARHRLRHVLGRGARGTHVLRRGA